MNMTPTPTVVIITPTFMQGSFIEECLNSVRLQSYKNYVHIIIDAMSTDSTADIVSKYASIDKRIIYIREPDQGPAEAINKGLNYLNGDIYCWLNSDDLFFDDDVISRIVLNFKKHPCVDVITGNGYYVDTKGRTLSPIIPSQAERMGRNTISYYSPFLQPSTFWKNNAIRVDQSLQYVFDWQLWLDFYDSGMQFLYLQDYFSCYRVHQSSLTFLDSTKRKKEILDFVMRNNKDRVQQFLCGLVYYLYLMSDATKLDIIKRVAKVINRLFYNLSGQKYLSS